MEHRYSCEVLEEGSPYSDMFPHNTFGARSVWFYPTNMPQMRYFHHSAPDDLAVVSTHQIALTATATADLAHQAAFTSRPWARRIPEQEVSSLGKYARMLYGL